MIPYSDNPYRALGLGFATTQYTKIIVWRELSDGYRIAYTHKHHPPDHFQYIIIIIIIDASLSLYLFVLRYVGFSSLPLSISSVSLSDEGKFRLFCLLAPDSCVCIAGVFSFDESYTFIEERRTTCVCVLCVFTDGVVCGNCV